MVYIMKYSLPTIMKVIHTYIKISGTTPFLEVRTHRAKLKHLNYLSIAVAPIKSHVSSI